MGNVVQNINATTTSVDAELQVRNGLDHTRVFDPECYILLGEMLQELKDIKLHLGFITEEEL